MPTPLRTESFPAPRPLRLSVFQAGDVVVTADDVDTARVDITALDDDDRTAALVHGARVELHDSELVVALPDRSYGVFRRTPRVRTDIVVPTGTSLQFRASSGDLRTTGTLGDVSLQSGSGDLVLAGVDGGLTARTGSGDVRIGRVARGSHVRSGSGDIAIGAAESDLTASSASGDVEVGVAHASAHLRTASGDVRVAAARRGVVSVVSASGDVEVGVVAGTGVWLDLSATSGSVSSALDPRAEAPERGADLRLLARSTSGDVRVVRAVGPDTPAATEDAAHRSSAGAPAAGTPAPAVPAAGA